MINILDLLFIEIKIKYFLVKKNILFFNIEISLLSLFIECLQRLNQKQPNQLANMFLL